MIDKPDILYLCAAMSFLITMFRIVCLDSRHSLAVLLLPLLFSTIVLISGRVDRPERVSARNGVVATDETLCSRIGRDILKKGGHAVDAAVAATLCIGVVSPSESGLGGGGFILVRPNEGEAKVFDMRETAPGRASENMFSKMKDINWKVSPLSIAVPGQLAGLHAIHKNYGKLPWASVVRPAERLARTGYQIPHMPVERGTPRLKKLADTLSAIAKHGMSIFYNGSIAQSLVEDIKKKRGIVTMNDFKKYRVVEREPLVANVMGYKLLTVPPPASGGAVVISILKTLSKFESNDVSMSLLVHRTVEALKYALAMRMDLGDPAFVNITTALDNMISDSTAEKIKNLINDNMTYDPEHYRSKWSQVDDHGTNHLCIVDRDRNVVTMTTSINTHFGTKIMSESTGIFFNNQMYDFSIPTSRIRPGAPANYVRPFKRPLSSMAPIILEKDGRVRAVIGSAGGLLIPDAVSQVLLNFFIRKKSILNAIMAPRFYHRLYPNVLLHEHYSSISGDRYEFNAKILGELKRKGHQLAQATSMMTTCQFVVQTLEGNRSGQLVAVTDPRKNRLPAGY